MIEVHNTEVFYQYHENKTPQALIGFHKTWYTLTSASARLVLMSTKVLRQYS
jgi:hypothetical protein